MPGLFRGFKRKTSNEKLYKRTRPVQRQVQPMEGTQVLHRIGEIWGIPTERLQPKIVYSPKLREVRGKAYPLLHKIKIGPRGRKGDAKGTREHEKTHIAHHLIMPEHERTGSSRGRRIISAASTGFFGGNPKRTQRIIKIETIADLAHKEAHFKSDKGSTRAFKEMFTKASTTTALLFWWGGLPAIAGIIGARTAARTAEFLLNKKPVQNIYANHGIDGIILFMANPPKVFGAIETRLWNRRMVKEGLLKPNGGLTEKGELLLRYRLPKQLIIERIEEAEKNRQHETARKAVP